jgi:Tol biopolymer transport system component
VALSAGCSDAREPVAPAADQPNGPGDAPIDARIAFASTRDGPSYVYVATADGSMVKRLARGEQPAWSPDGQRIAFHWWSGGTFGNGTAEVHVIGVDGSGDRVIAQGISPAWSPDGTKIVFNTVVGRPDGGVFVVNANGSGLTRLLSTEFEDPGKGDWLGWPAWSPDGRTIAFVRTNYEKPWQIYVMNADGSAPRLLTDHLAHDPSWSPDGSMLAFGSFRNIGSMNANGTDFRLYAPAPAFDPDWSPDGGSLLFNAFSSPIGDEVSAVGSRVRIYVVDRENGAVRQLIPNAVAPALANYWDHQAVWSRVDKGPWDY